MGVSQEKGGGLRGWESVCGEFGGLFFLFFRGRNTYQEVFETRDESNFVCSIKLLS